MNPEDTDPPMSGPQINTQGGTGFYGGEHHHYPPGGPPGPVAPAASGLKGKTGRWNRIRSWLSTTIGRVSAVIIVIIVLAVPTTFGVKSYLDDRQPGRDERIISGLKVDVTQRAFEAALGVQPQKVLRRGIAAENLHGQKITLTDTLYLLPMAFVEGFIDNNGDVVAITYTSRTEQPVKILKDWSTSSPTHTNPDSSLTLNRTRLTNLTSVGVRGHIMGACGAHIQALYRTFDGIGATGNLSFAGGATTAGASDGTAVPCPLNPGLKLTRGGSSANYYTPDQFADDAGVWSQLGDPFTVNSFTVSRIPVIPEMLSLHPGAL